MTTESWEEIARAKIAAKYEIRTNGIHWALYEKALCCSFWWPLRKKKWKWIPSDGTVVYSDEYGTYCQPIMSRCRADIEEELAKRIDKEINRCQTVDLSSNSSHFV